MNSKTIQEAKNFIERMNAWTRERTTLKAEDFRRREHSLLIEAADLLITLRQENWSKKASWANKMLDISNMFELHFDLLQWVKTEEGKGTLSSSEGDKLMDFFKSSSHNPNSPWFKKPD
jgi:hypothetical protein